MIASDGTTGRALRAEEAKHFKASVTESSDFSTLPKHACAQAELPIMSGTKIAIAASLYDLNMRRSPLVSWCLDHM